MDVNELTRASSVTDELKTESDNLLKSVNQVSKGFNTNSKSITRDLDNVRDASDNVADGVNKIGQNADQSAAQTLNLSSVIGKVKQVLGAAAIAKTVKEIGAAFIDVGKQSQQYFQTIRVGTGATGEALDGLMDSFRTVGRSVSNDLADVSTAIADVNTRLGYEGQELEAYSKTILQLSTLTGQSVGSLIESNAQLAQSYNLSAEEAEKSLNTIFLASQATGIGVQELTERARQFGPTFAELGYGLDDSIALISQWEKSGYETSRMLSSLQIATTKFTNAGLNANDAMFELLNNIRDTDDEAYATQLAVESFGREGIRMAQAIRGGAFEIHEFVDALSDSEGAIEENVRASETFEDKMNRLKNNVFLLVEPIGKFLVDALGGGIEFIIELMPGFLNAFSEIGAVAAEVYDVFEPLFSLLGELASTVLPVLGNVFQTVFKGIVRWAKWWFQNIFGYIRGLFDIFGEVIDFIKNVFTGNWEDAWQNVVNIFSTIFDGLLGLFREPLNFLIGGVNEFIGGINSITIPDWVPLIGGSSANIGKIPQFASGTDFFSGGLAIVGERGPELVSLPYGSSVYSHEDTSDILSASTQGRQSSVNVYEVSIEVPIDARGADRDELREMEDRLTKRLPKIIEKTLSNVYSKNKPIVRRG